jgi:hypothetical protein
VSRDHELGAGLNELVDAAQEGETVLGRERGLGFVVTFVTLPNRSGGRVPAPARA